MSTTQPQPADAANLHLLREVSVPAFMAKVAAETGYTPTDATEGDRVLSLGDMVDAAVTLYQQKVAAAYAGGTAAAVKAAVDAGFTAACGPTPSAAPPAADFLAVSGVRDAALSILGQAQPANGGTDGA